MIDFVSKLKNACGVVIWYDAVTIGLVRLQHTGFSFDSFFESNERAAHLLNLNKNSPSVGLLRPHISFVWDVTKIIFKPIENNNQNLISFLSV